MNQYKLFAINSFLIVIKFMIKFVKDYIDETFDTVDQMIATKSDNSNIVKKNLSHS